MHYKLAYAELEIYLKYSGMLRKLNIYILVNNHSLGKMGTRSYNQAAPLHACSLSRSISPTLPPSPFLYLPPSLYLLYFFLPTYLLQSISPSLPPPTPHSPSFFPQLLPP